MLDMFYWYVNISPYLLMLDTHMLDMLDTHIY